MATQVSDFYPGTSKAFTCTCKINDVAQDITSDTVTFRMKTLPNLVDGSAALSLAADVATSGASGIAIFELSASDNGLTVGEYYADIEWVLSDNTEYVILNQKIKVLLRTSDT